MVDRLGNRRPTRWFMTWRRTVFVGLVAAMVLAVGTVPAAAAPTPPPGWSDPLPGYGPKGAIPPPGPEDSYGYPSAVHLAPYAMRAVPTADELDDLDLKPYKEYTYGTLLRMLAYWEQVKRPLLKANISPQDLQAEWQSYVESYVRNFDNMYRGNGFATYNWRKLGIAGSTDYTFDKKISAASIRPDAYPIVPHLMRIYESKDTRTLEGREIAQLNGYVRTVNATGKQAVYLFRQVPEPEALESIAKANAATDINVARAAAGLPLVDAIVARIQPGTPQPIPPANDDLSVFPLPAASAGTSASAAASGKPSAAGSPDSKGGAKKNGPAPVKPSGGGVMVAPGSGQLPTDGGLDVAIENSPNSPEDAARQQATTALLAEDLADAPGGEDIGADEKLGGVDFSTLELRYVSDSYLGGSGLRYAFSANPGPKGQPSYGGRQAAELASDAFFVWLELPTSAFTVNLNPDEPDRIIDSRFGRTDAGRILLEADLQMKKTVAKLIHPDTSTGKQFWAGLRGAANCLTMRQWIVPSPATVREDNGQLYILDAPLDVKMESDYIKAKGVGQHADCQGQSPADTQANEALYRSLILPLVKQAVNTAPDYTDLRLVYVSRVAAQWYRERSATKHTAYSDLVDKGDVSNWPSRTPWSAREVFDRYVKSYTDGEFNVTHTTQQGDRILTETFVYGGVDLSRIPRTKLSGAAFNKQQPALPSTVAQAVYAKTGTQDGKLVWLGGQSTPRPLTEIARGVASPTSEASFWVFTTLPLVVWLTGGALLLARRRRHRLRTG